MKKNHKVSCAWKFSCMLLIEYWVVVVGSLNRLHHGALYSKEMKSLSAQVISCCVDDKSKTLRSTYMVSFNTCLTVGKSNCSSPSTKELHGFTTCFISPFCSKWESIQILWVWLPITAPSLRMIQKVWITNKPFTHFG